jgi:signal transduction histidine kinase
VTAVKDFGDLPLLPLDRSRLMQILVNLIGNATQAMAGGGSRRLTLRAAMAEEGHGRLLRICVEDEGIGIPAENLTRIFNHGFTTRPNGHGFGLHSCALAAREMGGRLTARSDGPGRGACFTLELPIREIETGAQRHAGS